MINLDDRILSQVNESELFLLLHIAKRMKDSRMTAWPSLERIAKDCNWDERTVKRWRESLINKGLLAMKQEPGKAPMYKLKGTGISVYFKADGVELAQKEGGTKYVGGTKNEGAKNAVEGVQKMYPEVINKEVINKGEYESENLAALDTPTTRQDFPYRSTTTPTPFFETVEEKDSEKEFVPAAGGAAATQVEDQARHISLRDRPNAETPGDLQERMREFYKCYPNEWKDKVLQMSKGSRYPEAKQKEIVLSWCCHVIKEGLTGRTFGQMNAHLQAWFLKQPDADRWSESKQTTTGQHQQPPVYVSPKPVVKPEAYTP